MTAFAAEHPATGDVANIVPIALADELIRLALQTGATVDIVRSTVPVETAADGAIPEAGTPPPRTGAATLLDDLGGVGATLRFTLDQDQVVAEMEAGWEKHAGRGLTQPHRNMR